MIISIKILLEKNWNYFFNSSKNQIKNYTLLNGEQATTHISQSETVALFQLADNVNMIGDSVSIRFSDNRCIGYSKSVLDKIFDVRKYDNYNADLIARTNSLLFIQ